MCLQSHFIPTTGIYTKRKKNKVFNGLSCQAAKPGKKEKEPAAAAAAYSTPADGPPAPPPVAENPSEKSENVLVAPDAESSQDAIPSASGGNSWDLLNFLPVLTNFWPDWELSPI